MVTRRYIVVLMALGMVGITLGFVTEFTQKREKKSPSVSTLKEECCEQFGEFLKQVPRLLQLVAHVQTKALMVIQGYWESDKQSWCAQASRQKLSQCQDRLIELQKQMNKVLDDCEQLLKEI